MRKSEKDGRVSQADILLSPSSLLSSAAVVGLGNLEMGWDVEHMTTNQASAIFLIVCRFRRFLDSEPPNHGAKAERMKGKGKWEKALKFYDLAIADSALCVALFAAI